MHRLADPRVRSTVVALLLVVMLAVTAVLLASALGDERRLAEAANAVSSAPERALEDLAGPEPPATSARARAVRTAALVRLGRLRDAERLERSNVRSRPDDVYAVRRLYEIQLLRQERGAARRTRRLLLRLDPLFASGGG